MLGFPLLVLLAAYIAIALYTGNWWPWLELVHESGERSLIDTIFYYEHASRELLLDVILGIAVAGCAFWVFPATTVGSGRRLVLLSTATGLVIGTIIVGTIWVGGLSMLSDNLLQMHTRPGEPLSFGSHWRYHLLSRSMLMLVSFGFAGLFVLGLGGRQVAGNKIGQQVYFGAIGSFLGLTMVFSPSLDPFISPVFLGHQVREAFTHGLVTLPLTWWLCLALSRNREVPVDGSVSLAWPLVCGAGGLLLAVYLLVGALGTSAVSQGQTKSLSLLIFPHFFEHVFSYLVVPLVAGLVYESVTLVTRGKRSSI
jgi:hypothetical protein